jgi:hypothetical protein
MFKPELGMEFSSSEEAFQFYNMYSWVAGFSIRLGDNYINKKGQRTMQEYKCQREVCSFSTTPLPAPPIPTPPHPFIMFFPCTNNITKLAEFSQTYFTRDLTRKPKILQPDVDAKQ